MQCVQELVHFGAEVDATNKNGETPLHAKIKQGRFDCVTGLLAKGANIALKDSNGDNALHLAVEVIC